MKQDIHKLGVWLEKVCREGIAREQRIIESKLTEENRLSPLPPAKAS